MRTHVVEDEQAREAPERAEAPLPPAAEAVLALQRSAGNRAVANVLARVGPTRHQPKRASKPKPPSYLLGGTGARFGASSKSWGGSSAEVDIGPAGGDSTNYGSVPKQGECTAVEKLNQDPNYTSVDTWVKGHLQNDNLGGPGLSPNLTPMTDAANKQHEKSFEKPVKTAIVHCALLANPEYSPIKKGTAADDYWYGVEYDVRTDNVQAYPAGPAHARAVNTNLICNATYVKQDKEDDGSTEDLDATEIANLKLPALPAANHSSPCV